MGNQEEAKKSYIKAIELDSNGNKISLGCLHLLLGNLDEAKKELIKETNKSSPEGYISYVNLGDVHYLQGNKSEAKRCFKLALTRCVANNGLANDLAYAWLLVVTGNPTDGQKELQSIILSKTEPSPGLLSGLIRDTEILFISDKQLPSLVDMHQLLLNKRAAWESGQ